MPSSSNGTQEDLPSYVAPPRRPEPARSLDSSTSSAARSTHTWTLTNRENAPWAALTLKSRAHRPTHVPYFFQGDVLSGTFELNLVNTDSIQAVEVEAVGVLGSGSIDEHVFFRSARTLWSASDSATPSPMRSGNHKWDYTLNLPPTVHIVSKRHGINGEYPIPPTFDEEGVRVTIQYDLVCHIKRTTFKVNSRLGSRFLFTPLNSPPPMSSLRQLAYQMGSPLLSPEADPAGWHALAPAKISGTLFTTRQVSIECVLSISKPLSFTRGTVIPLSVLLTSSDELALDLLCAPGALNIRLFRHVCHEPSVTAKVRAGRFEISGRSRPPGSGRSQSMAGVDFKVVTSPVGPATFWSSLDAAEEEGRRRLDGEVQLPLDLKPTTTLGHLEVWYTIMLHSPEAPGFVPDDTLSLLATPIEITTAYGTGPRPTAMTPPGYNERAQSARSFSTVPVIRLRPAGASARGFR